MTPQELLTTTHSVRRRLDLSCRVPREVILDFIRIALQASTGSNQQDWQWMVVTDPATRRRIGKLYPESWSPSTTRSERFSTRRAIPAERAGRRTSAQRTGPVLVGKRDRLGF
jgi:nitroreductase